MILCDQDLMSTWKWRRRTTTSATRGTRTSMSISRTVYWDTPTNTLTQACDKSSTIPRADHYVQVRGWFGIVLNLVMFLNPILHSFKSFCVFSPIFYSFNCFQVSQPNSLYFQFFLCFSAQFSIVSNHVKFWFHCDSLSLQYLCILCQPKSQ